MLGKKCSLAPLKEELRIQGVSLCRYYSGLYLLLMVITVWEFPLYLKTLNVFFGFLIFYFCKRGFL